MERVDGQRDCGIGGRRGKGEAHNRQKLPDKQKRTQSRKAFQHHHVDHQALNRQRQQHACHILEKRQKRIESNSRKCLRDQAEHAVRR